MGGPDGIEQLGAAAPERAGREVDRLKAHVAAVKPKEASCSRRLAPLTQLTQLPQQHARREPH
jgi:hypothetical protein